MDQFSEGNKPPQESVEKPRPTRVLVAEDDPSLVPLMKAIYETLKNVDATFCTTGEEAIELLKQAKEAGGGFDRIITDNGLAGDFTGFDVARFANELDTPPFVIMLTSHDLDVHDHNTLEQLKAQGIGRVVGKKLSMEQFMGLATEPPDRLDALLGTQP